MEHENDEEIISNIQEETVDSTNTDTDESSEESVEDIRARLAKAEELANNYKIRAEKAEKKSKDAPVQRTSSQKDEGLSTMDIIALSKANLEQEDMAEVLDFAKYKGITVSEALKSNQIKATLQLNAELRNTAAATNTGGAKRSSGKVSDEALMSSASKGNIPENDDEMDRLVRLKMFGGRK